MITNDEIDRTLPSPSASEAQVRVLPVKLVDEILSVLDNYADPTGYMDEYGESRTEDAELHEGLLAKATAEKLRSALSPDQVEAAPQGTETPAPVTHVVGSGQPIAYVCEADILALAHQPDGTDMSIAPRPLPEYGMKFPLYAEHRKVEATIMHCAVCGADEASTYLGAPGPGIVRCFAVGCDAQVGGYATDDEAIAEWNRRAVAMDAAMTEAYGTSDDDLTDCFRHHITTTIGWLAFGARPGPEMQMYEEGFKAGYRRCQSDNEPELGEEEDELSDRARKLVGKLRESIKAGAVQLADVEDAIDLIIDQAAASAPPPAPRSTPPSPPQSTPSPRKETER